MKVTYDPIADAMYIYFSSHKKSTQTKEVSEGVLVDYAGDDLIGIEVLDASKHVSKEVLQPGKFNVLHSSSV